MEKALEFKLNGKLNNWNDIAFNGITLKSFYRKNIKGKNKIECWLKVLILIDSFYRNKNNKDRSFFVSTSAIYKTLKGYGNEYHFRTIQKAIAKLVAMNFIRKEDYPADEEELHLNPKNKHLRRRKLIPNTELINEYLSVYDEDDLLLRALAEKDPRKKLIYKRPYSYVKNIVEKYKSYVDKVKRKAYHSVNEMFSYWCVKKSSKYFSISKLVKKFIPSCLEDRQEKANKALISKASDKGIITEDMVLAYQDGSEYMTTDEMKELIGWKVPKEYIKYLESAGYEINFHGYITGYHKRYKTRGFERLDISDGWEEL